MPKDENSYNSSVFMVTTALVIISIAFEHGEHWLLHKPSKVTRPVVRSMFGELTALGFIGVILFVVESTSWLQSLSKLVFNETHTNELTHIIHTVHMALFLIMVIFLLSVLLLMVVAMRQQTTWSDNELACLNRPGLLTSYNTYLQKRERTNCIVLALRWCLGTRDVAYERVVYNGLRSRFIKAGEASSAPRHELSAVNEDGNVGIVLDADNSEVYRKKLVVHAFRTRDPVTFNKHWGASKGKGGDYVIVGVDDDLYVCPKDVFEDTYVAVAGEANKYRKTGHMYARRMPHEFKVRTSGGLQRGPPGAYLVQDGKTGEQYSVTAVEFEENYEKMESDETRQKDVNDLPKDFDFASYLTERLGTTLAEIVSVDWRTWLVMELVVCILWVVRLTGSAVAFAFVDHGVGVGWMVMAILTMRKLGWIREQLTPKSLLRSAHPFASDHRVVPLAKAIQASRRDLLLALSTPTAAAPAKPKRVQAFAEAPAAGLKRVGTMQSPSGSVRFRTDAGEVLEVSGAVLCGQGEANAPKFTQNPLTRKVGLCASRRMPPNKHQQLFWFGAEGPAFMVRLIRTTLLFMSLYLSSNMMMLMSGDCKSIPLSYQTVPASYQCSLLSVPAVPNANITAAAPIIVNHDDPGRLLYQTMETAVDAMPLNPGVCAARVALTVVPPLVCIMLLPRLITLFVTVSNVEMMTKQKVVQEVLRKQRTQKSMRALRLLSALRAYTKRAEKAASVVGDEESKGGDVAAIKHGIHGAAVRVYGAPGTAKYIQRRHQLREAFAIFDREHTGHVRAENITSLFHLLGLGDQAEVAADSILAELDEDGHGSIEFEEFFDWNAAQEEHVDAEDLTRDIFNIIDRDKSSDITVSELRNTLSSLGAVMTSEDILTIVREADHNNTGSISYHEFEALMRNSMKGSRYL